MQHVAEEFLKKHLTNVPKTIPDKIKFWLHTANNIERVYPDSDAPTLARKRRYARNNLRRLVNRYPHLLPSIASELERGQ